MLARQTHYGLNSLPTGKLTPLSLLFLRQFLNPLIYVLVAAAAVSIALGDVTDAGFIGFVLISNAIIGMLQEHHAAKSAQALRQLLDLRSFVIRNGEQCEIDARQIVPGDIVLLESGAKVPADLRLSSTTNLEIDESLLTGESLSVQKNADTLFSSDTPLAERNNMAFAGTLVQRGRALGIATSIGLHTEVGKIAKSVLHAETAKPPLLVRMERFTQRIALAIGIAIAGMSILALLQGAHWFEVLTVSVALAVAAIPEALPVAITVALAISLRRMAKRNVIVRKLAAVEALGSCTFIASDKTGTLTLNQITLRSVALPNLETVEVAGEGIEPGGQVLFPPQMDSKAMQHLLRRLARAGALCNEGFFEKRAGEWSAHGDAVDVALLVFAQKLGIARASAEADAPEIARIPFESERQFAATLHQIESKQIAFVKGAYERILPMCSHAAAVDHEGVLDTEAIHAQATALAQAGYKVIALASGAVELRAAQDFATAHLRDLQFLGLVGLIDPLRPEASHAVEECRTAGIAVAMVTGDHPLTAFAIARKLDLAHSLDQVITGAALQRAKQTDSEVYRNLVLHGRVFARVDPQQKLDIVHALREAGHFVAVTGDGANDAPAMSAAHVAIAMGKRGTDIARESADLILTDDHFASIVAGVKEGRVAYANVRKVVFLSLSTGAAEVALFVLSLAAGLPVPLFAAQLLWLNLVTNGIQDVALAFEPGEGDELQHSPRAPREPIFNRLMIERCILSALVIGGVGFGYFAWALHHGVPVAEARNGLLLFIVLCENIQVGNARSELHSSLSQNPLRNPLLLFGTLVAQLVHIGAMFTPGLRDILGIAPVSASHWIVLFCLSLSVWVVMEIYKFVRRRENSQCVRTIDTPRH